MTFVGAGSVEFTRNVVTDLCGYPEFRGQLRLTLYDITPYTPIVASSRAITANPPRSRDASRVAAAGPSGTFATAVAAASSSARSATSQSAIARLENGGRPPRIDTLLRLAEALDCDLAVELRPREAGTDTDGRT